MNRRDAVLALAALGAAPLCLRLRPPSPPGPPPPDPVPAPHIAVPSGSVARHG